MLKLGENFEKLYAYENKDIKNEKFTGELTFNNIYNFHINLIKKIIINSNRNLDDFNFYLADLTNIIETQELCKDLLDNILYNIKKNVIIPNIVYKKIEINYLFNQYFNINILFNKNIF
jgi:hypothetical protein